LIGYYFPQAGAWIESASAYQINFLIAVLIWIMTMPALIQVDLATLKEIRQYPKALLLTTGINYLIQPFTMFGFAILFFRIAYGNIMTPEEQDQYIAGCVMLGAGPCTAMVFVWSLLVKGDATYTLVQVALNDIILMIVYAPLVGLLIGATNIPIPWDTVLLSTAVFIVIPFIVAFALRMIIIRFKGRDFIAKKLLPPVKPVTQVALLISLIIIFIAQGEKVVNEPVHVLLIAVPLLIQTYMVYFLSLGLGYLWKIPFKFAAPGALIGTSNFFELAVAVAISLYGTR
jgi:ACR3 family arsenite transporter